MEKIHTHNSILSLLVILIVVISYFGWNIEKAIREVGHAQCQVERLIAEDNPNLSETSKQAIATIICGPNLLGKFAK